PPVMIHAHRGIATAMAAASLLLRDNMVLVQGHGMNEHLLEGQVVEYLTQIFQFHRAQNTIFQFQKVAKRQKNSKQKGDIPIPIPIPKGRNSDIPIPKGKKSDIPLPDPPPFFHAPEQRRHPLRSKFHAGVLRRVPRAL
ncbi:MAG: hypothetical protein ACK559_09720, partial [bacterium]